MMVQAYLSYTVLVSTSFAAPSGISSFSLFELVRVLDFRLKWGCGIFSLKSTSRYENEKSKFEAKRVKDIRLKLAPPFLALLLDNSGKLLTAALFLPVSNRRREVGFFECNILMQYVCTYVNSLAQSLQLRQASNSLSWAFLSFLSWFETNMPKNTPFT